MLGDYLKKHDEMPQSRAPELGVPGKKRTTALGTRGHTSMPVPLQLLLPDINKLLESDKKKRHSSVFEDQSEELALAETHNTIPETVNASKNHIQCHNSVGLLSSGELYKMPVKTVTTSISQQPHATPNKFRSADQNPMMKPPAMIIAEETSEQPLATPIKQSRPDEETSSTVLEAEKENFTPLKIQVGPVSATPATSREPLSLIYSDSSEPSKKSPDASGVPSSDNYVSCDTKSKYFVTPPTFRTPFSRSRLHGTSDKDIRHSAPRAQFFSLSSNVPLHPMIQQHCNVGPQLCVTASATNQQMSSGSGIRTPHSKRIPHVLDAKRSSCKFSSDFDIIEEGSSEAFQIAALPEDQELQYQSDSLRGPKSNLSVDSQSNENKIASDCRLSVENDREIPFLKGTGITVNDNLQTLSQVSAFQEPRSLPAKNIHRFSSEGPVKHPIPCTDAVVGEHIVAQDCHLSNAKKPPVFSQNGDINAENSIKNSTPQRSPIKTDVVPESHVKSGVCSAGAVTGSKLKSSCEGQKVFQMPMPVSSSNTKPATGLNHIVVNGKSYTVLSLLGRGGSSVVYQVLDTSTSRLLAIKCVTLSGPEDSISNGYLNEIKLLQQLQDGDCVIRMFSYEHRLEENMLYVVMEKGDTDLSKLIKDTCRSRRISVAMILYFWLEMLSAVSFIHKRGTIHSDLKPSNFLLVSGRLKLIDFGIASAVQGDMTSVFKDSMTGTFNYISPEAVCGYGSTEGQRYKISYKSDVWSLGCILYNLVYGHTPFHNVQGQFQKLSAIVNASHQITFPPPRIEGCPPILLQAMQVCLKRNPSERPSVDDLLLMPYLGCNCPERAILTQISTLLACVEFEQESDCNSNSPSSILRSIQQIFIQNRTSLPFFKGK